MSKKRRKDIEYKDEGARGRILANLKKGKRLELRKKNKQDPRQLSLFEYGFSLKKGE